MADDESDGSDESGDSGSSDDSADNSSDDSGDDSTDSGDDSTDETGEEASDESGDESGDESDSGSGDDSTDDSSNAPDDASDESASKDDRSAESLVAEDDREDVPVKDEDAEAIQATDDKEDVPQAEVRSKGGNGKVSAGAGGKAQAIRQPSSRNSAASVKPNSAARPKSAPKQSTKLRGSTPARPVTSENKSAAQPAQTGQNMQQRQAPPLWTKVIYGFFDDHDKWQQSSPLTWEEAGHQIAAAIYLGRHPFVWDGGLRLWRPLILEPEHGAQAVHSTLENAGWSPEQRAAVLGGPESWRRHWQSGRGHTDHIVSVDPKKVEA